MPKSRKIVEPAHNPADDVLSVLQAEDMAGAVQKARVLTAAATAEPLVMAVSINRVTGAFTFSAGISNSAAQRDLHLLHEVAVELGKRFANDLVALAGAQAVQETKKAGA